MSTYESIIRLVLLVNVKIFNDDDEVRIAMILDIYMKSVCPEICLSLGEI